MLLKSIKLENFRQFRDEYIDFAKGENGKNVTIILGENGTGKTTFAQAFSWCLYGETGFSDKVILNRIVANDMTPSEEKEVKVTLSLRHGEVDYKLIRRQVYHKDRLGNVKGDNTVFDIELKDKNGNTTFVDQSKCELEVKQILPKELSRYFFFDGERINKMSKDISDGKKATDFADAVKGLLGLNAMSSALVHFNPRSKNSVIGSYQQAFNTKSNKDIGEYTAIIEDCMKKLGEIDSRFDELDSEIAAAESRKAEKSVEIKQYAEGEKLQNEKENLQQSINTIEKVKATINRSICSDFNTSMSSFFSISLIKRALEILSTHDFLGKDIPYIRKETIEYLLKQRVCICGTHLDEGTVAYDKVKELIDFIPPKSISGSVSDFKEEAKRRVSKLINADLMKRIEENLETVSKQEEEKANKIDQLDTIDKKLSGGDVRGKVRSINQEINTCNNVINKGRKERDKLNQEKGRLEGELSRANTARKSLTLLDESNKKTQLYLTCAEKIYKELNEVYKNSEEKVRNQLQDTINDIFKQIYEGGLSLTIDEKYHISVQANNYDGDVETSTAQSNSVIFAFITGIIQMARENRNATDEDAKLLSSEPYPLVMDAPLSSFDKRRIKTVCEALPKTAEQVIIFIKDTDGDLAEKYMGNKIGSRHHFEKKNEFETMLV
ncbi:MAG: AAA family ATPase [Eubacterium sp.]|jgi:DNA sulfur modification protein DndD|nr:AAA family ATPase [Eubacterium sp.]